MGVLGILGKMFPQQGTIMSHSLQNGKNAVKTQLYLLAMRERVDHIAVYNYMFWPLSTIVWLHYLLLQSKTIQYARCLLLVMRSHSHELHIIIQLL